MVHTLNMQKCSLTIGIEYRVRWFQASSHLLENSYYSRIILHGKHEKLLVLYVSCSKIVCKHRTASTHSTVRVYNHVMYSIERTTYFMLFNVSVPPISIRSNNWNSRFFFKKIVNIVLDILHEIIPLDYTFSQWCLTIR